MTTTASTTAQLESIRRHIREFALRDLFRDDISWDIPKMTPPAVTVGQETYTLQPVAQKRGVVVFICSPNAEGGIPDYATRRAIDTQVAKLHHEHLLIYVDQYQSKQIWQWVRRQPGKAAAYREHPYFKGQSGEALAQRLNELSVDLLEEESLTLPDVLSRVQKSLDVERVTRRFYDRFKTEHAAFLQAIAGIAAPDQREWYASLMLNRMMFSYFIQKKGFLDGDTDYLRNRLKLVQSRFGPDQFDRFYREFLLHFFHDGLGRPEGERDADMRALLGRIPYLNGGLFEEHKIEADHRGAIAIPDAAFVRVFDFFDDYSWHLDERPGRDDKEINPDVLGYIFEKYINQKQMGAYYTKEDITGYISRNTILPFLFDTARKDCKIAFEPGGEVWRLLRDDPDRYIYAAILKGADLLLPDDIAAGLDDVAQRTGWNRPADPDYALPTETWREHVARRRRCLDLRAKLAAGEVVEINDLITYNLDIERFARDVIERCEGPELLRAFWKALERVTVLDPTCGSGAFLFAALGILEPLYDACLDRMRAFVEDFDRAGATEQKGKDFRNVLTHVAEHPSRDYFVRKTIIINNLYGVDIMEEAVEIAKLRLFLSLVARAETWEQIEPLPDIDFNIRAGNTLVGFATLDAVREAMMYGPHGQMRMLSAEDEAILSRIDERAEIAARAFARFREMQSEHGMAKSEFRAAKEDLGRRLADLHDELDAYLAREYGVDANDLFAFGPWRDSHQPFHWFIEFYGIVQSRGGFDVIIGNPPYVEYGTAKSRYAVRGYSTELCGNLYAFVLERSVALTRYTGRMSMIVPIALMAGDRTVSMRDFLKSHVTVHSLSSFGFRPSHLFDGVNHRLCIPVCEKAVRNPASAATSNYNLWSVEERDVLFQRLSFTRHEYDVACIGKFGPIDVDVDGRLELSAKRLGSLHGSSSAGYPVYFSDAVLYWSRATNFPPRFRNVTRGKDMESSTLKTIYAADPAAQIVMLAALNSNLFFWYWVTHSDCRHLTVSDIQQFPVPASLMGGTAIGTLRDIVSRLMRDYDANSVTHVRNQVKTGRIEYQRFFPGKSKPIIDEIDRVLAAHYGFTDEELDFIINYDIKYRMGQENGEGNGNGNGDDEE